MSVTFQTAFRWDLTVIPAVAPLPEDCLPQIRQRILNKTKPAGSLGQIEHLAEQLAQIQRGSSRLQMCMPTMLVFAADHGIARHPVSIAPQAVTRQMLLNFVAGGAAINCFCDAAQMRLKVIDAGILEPVSVRANNLLIQRIGAGTADLSQQAAMTEAQCQQALLAGAELARQEIGHGVNLLGFGEMGIGNSSSASALLALVAGLPLDVVVGRGTGIDDAQLQLKRACIQAALTRVRGHNTQPVDVITAMVETGGFEIIQITGAMLAAAEQGITILVDGFIVSVAALLACYLQPHARAYMVFGHCSAELAHRTTLELLQARPLLDLGLRLGEGTGAALALPLLRAACCFYNDMATFETAGINGVEV